MYITAVVKDTIEQLIDNLFFLLRAIVEGNLLAVADDSLLAGR